MKIAEAKKLYSSQLDALRIRKQELAKRLKEETEQATDGASFDRVELSKELSQVEEQYDQTMDVMERIQDKETIVHNAEVARQQSEAVGKAMDDMAKCLEIARRIGTGASVPAKDEKMLMEYSHELYMSAKNMALMNMQKEQKEYDSLIEEEDEGQKDTRSASEIAGDTEIAVGPPPAAPAENSTEAS